MSDKKDFQDEAKESVHKIWLAGLGALSVAEEEGSRLFKNLVEKGEGYQKKGQEQVNDVKARVEETAKKARSDAEETFDKVESKVEEMMSETLGKIGVPSRDEIRTLTQRVEELTRVVENLKSESQKTAPAK